MTDWTAEGGLVTKVTRPPSDLQSPEDGAIEVREIWAIASDNAAAFATTDRDTHADQTLQVAVTKVVAAFALAHRLGRCDPDNATNILTQTRANAEHILTAAQTRAARVLPGGVAERGQGCDTEAGK